MTQCQIVVEATVAAGGVYENDRCPNLLSFPDNILDNNCITFWQWTLACSGY